MNETLQSQGPEIQSLEERVREKAEQDIKNIIDTSAKEGRTPAVETVHDTALNTETNMTRDVVSDPESGEQVHRYFARTIDRNAHTVDTVAIGVTGEGKVLSATKTHEQFGDYNAPRSPEDTVTEELSPAMAALQVKGVEDGINFAQDTRKRETIAA